MCRCGDDGVVATRTLVAPVADDPETPPARSRPEGPSTAAIAVGYVVGRFPAVSHTFILREVEALRRLGVRIETFSIWRAVAQYSSQAERTAANHLRRAATSVGRAIPRTPRRADPASVSLRVDAHTVDAAEPTRHPGPRVAALLLHRGDRRKGECKRLEIRHLHGQFASQATDVALLINHFERRRSGAFTWSIAVHGPVEFHDTSINRLPEKVSGRRPGDVHQRLRAQSGDGPGGARALAQDPGWFTAVWTWATSPRGGAPARRVSASCRSDA